MADEKKRYYTSRAEIVPASVNPWAGELAHTIKKGRKITGFASAHHSLVNTETGEIAGDIAVVGVQNVVDKEEFIKLFGGGIMEVFELTKPAKDVFRAVLSIYLDQKNKPDQMYINYELVRRNFGFDKNRSSFTNGMNELCVRGFLAPVELMDNMFWINPNLFYKGDRIRIVHDYVRAGSKAALLLAKQPPPTNQGALPLDDPNASDE